MTVPFDYPPAPLARRHGPAGYADHSGNRPWLRDEFVFRCVYCLQREMWSRDRHRVFSVDHVVPQSAAPALTCVYSNLVYACLWYNSARQDVPVIDPTDEAMGHHVAVEPDGTTKGLTQDGELLVELLNLNAQAAVKERLRVLRVRDRYERTPDEPGAKVDYLETFGFPEDLPDLRALRPPAGKSSRADCHHSRKERGDLPVVY